MDKKTVLLFGASGLVGGHCLQQLIKHPDIRKIKSFARGKLTLHNLKLDQHIIDFNHLEMYKSLMIGDVAICCIGTTMKKAGSKEKFYRIDFEYCYEIAKLCKENNVNNFILISSIGANEKSLFYYSKVKGKIENAIHALCFDSFHALRPSLLLGKRDEYRLGEELASYIGKNFSSWLGKYRPISAEQVAKAAVQLCFDESLGSFYHESQNLSKF